MYRVLLMPFWMSCLECMSVLIFPCNDTDKHMSNLVVNRCPFWGETYFLERSLLSLLRQEKSHIIKSLDKNSYVHVYHRKLSVSRFFFLGSAGSLKECWFYSKSWAWFWKMFWSCRIRRILAGIGSIILGKQQCNSICSSECDMWLWKFHLILP